MHWTSDQRVPAEMVVRSNLDFDRGMLAQAAEFSRPAFRCWRCPAHVVVLGRASKPGEDVNQDFCRRHRIPIVRRQSGGGTVLIGPGTLQWSCALPVREFSPFASISKTKAFCNELLRAALPDGDRLCAEDCGDLTLGKRKVGGVALRRRRDAVMIHGTLLATADLELISVALRHPTREPDYRRGRGHRAFLATLGPIDPEFLEHRVRLLFAGLSALPA